MLATFALHSQRSNREAGLTGELLRNGRPVTGQVMVKVWPTAARLQELRVGQRFNTPVVMNGTIGKNGQFSVELDPASLSADFRDKADQVDLQVTVTDGKDQGDWFLSVLRSDKDTGVVPSGQRAAWVPTGERDRSVAEHVALDLGTEKAEAASSPKSRRVNTEGRFETRDSSPTLAVVPKNQAEWQPTGTGATADATLAPTETCSTSPGGIITNLPETFAHIYGWSGAKGTIDFDTGSNHTLGVAIQRSSGWSGSGTQSISTGSGATVTGAVDANALNRVNYRDYWSSCSPYPTRKPYGFYALLPGGQFTFAGHTNYSYCSGPYVSGQSVWKNKGTNVTFSQGVDVGPVNVSAQSGWNTGTKLQWVMTASTRICGSSSVGWPSSADLDARRW